MDRNTDTYYLKYKFSGSPSSRRAWIEIRVSPIYERSYVVALLAEGVDRNTNSLEPLPLVVPVALLAEGVDRNNHRTNVNINNRIVALLAEGVDRNLPDDHFQPFVHRRPPHGGRG